MSSESKLDFIRTRTEARSDTQTIVQSDTRTEARSDTQTEARSDTRRIVQSDTGPNLSVQDPNENQFQTKSEPISISGPNLQQFRESTNSKVS